jgi:hypothetical protein
MPLFALGAVFGTRKLTTCQLTDFKNMIDVSVDIVKENVQNFKLGAKVKRPV